MAASDIKAGRAFVELGLKNNLLRGLSQARAQLKAFGSNVMGMGKQVMGVGASITALGVGIAAAFAMPIQAAGDLMETVSKFEAVFADQTDGVRAFADEFRTAVGRSKQDVYTGLSTFQAFFQGLNFGGQEAAGFSKEMTGLAVDFASFHNMQDPEAMQRFISALSGSGEVLSMYGVNIMEAALNQKLLAMGFPTIAKGATEAQKVLARMAIIKETMGRQGAVGDAIRTSGSFSNQMKALSAAIADTAAEVGEALLPAITPIVTLVASLIKQFSIWAKENANIIRTVAMVAVGIVGAGAAIMAIGAAIVGVGATISALGTILGGIGALLGLILSPIGLITAGLVGGIYAWTQWTDSGKAAVAGLSGFFTSLFGTVTDTWQGVVAAIGAGDLALAGRVAMAGLNVVWQQGVQAANKLWQDAKWFFLSTWNEAASSLASIFVQAWSGIKSGWLELTSFMRQVWNNAIMDAATVWAKLQERLLIARGMPRETAEAITSVAMAGIANNRQSESGDIEAQRTAGQAKIAADSAGAQAILESDRQREQDRINSQYDQALASRQQELDAARAELGAATAAAKAKRKATVEEGNAAVAAAQEAAAPKPNAGTSSFGSFSAAALGMVGAGGIQQRQLEEQRRTREEAAKAAAEQKRRDERLQELVKSNQWQVVG